jgi:hypothetical protein
VSPYARPTMGPNQEGRPEDPGRPVEGVDAFPDAAVPSEAAAEAEARERALRALEGVLERTSSGLGAWALVVVLGSVGGVLAGQVDLALFLAVAALFALTQAWDARDRTRAAEPRVAGLLPSGPASRALRALVGMLMPCALAVAFGMFAVFAHTLPATVAHVAAMQAAAAAAVVCAALALPPLARIVASAFFGRGPGSHTGRLAASLAVGVLLLPLPIRLVFDELLPMFRSTGRPLVEIGALVGQLAGEVGIALAAVGLGVSRDLRGVRDRLGLGGMGPREWLLAVAGLAAVGGFNSGMEWLERAWFPALWREDQAMGQLIAGDILPATAIVLGVSAGVGEELVVRGALQPRAGLFWASVLFAAAHVQYTWFGMLVVAGLGIVLGLVRQHANTTTAIVVHAAYDIIAALGTPR